MLAEFTQSAGPALQEPEVLLKCKSLLTLCWSKRQSRAEPAWSPLQLPLSISSRWAELANQAPSLYRSIRSVVERREAGFPGPPRCGLSSAAQGSPVGACTALWPPLEGSAGELGGRDMVSAGRRGAAATGSSPLLRRRARCGRRRLGRGLYVAPPFGRACAELRAPPGKPRPPCLGHRGHKVVLVLHLELAC